MAQAKTTPAMTSATYLEAVRAARRQGQRQLAWAHLKAGQALDPEGSLVGLALEEADLLSVEGRPEAAREVLLIALKGHPRNAWVPRGLADLAHREGDIANAWLYLKQAQGLDPEGKMAVLTLLEADLLIHEARLAEAELLLETMTQTHPENVWGYLRLATVRRETQGIEAEYTTLQEALIARPGDVTIELRLVEMDLAANAWPVAAKRLEDMYASRGPQPRILLPLLRCYRRMGAAKQEEAALIALIEAHPEHPGALRYLFDTRAADIPADQLNDLIELARKKVGEAVAEDLRLGVLVRTAAFAEAMALIRRVKRGQRTLAEARMLVQVLFGTYQFRLGLRYLTFCLRRWPNDMGLLDIYVIRGLKQGQVQEVTRWLDVLSATVPEQALLGQRLMVHGFSGDLDSTLACYEKYPS